MTQQEVILEALEVIEKEDPDLRLALTNESPMETQVRTYAFINSLNAGAPAQTIFKARPQGATNIVCYWTAEFNYAQALATCGLITDPVLRKQCESNAMDVYCDAYDACAKA